ncbi:glycosyltransferase family 4 protein [Patescibacteria group bacterium]|nr:glycosyltransferase family 4 protein [Patescibacteria group bacterium]
MSTSKKQKLLFLTGVSPAPKESGGATRVYNTIKNLSQHFHLYLVIFKPENYQFKPEDYSYLKKHSRQFLFFDIKDFRSQKSFITDLQPYWFSPWHNDEIQITIHNLIKKHQFKFVHIEQTQLCYLVNYLPIKTKKIFVAQDIGIVTFWRRLRQIKKFSTKIIHLTRWLEIFLYEKKYLPKFDLICAVSNTDKKKLRKIYELKNICTVRNGIENISFIKKDPPSNFIKLGYIGSFDHPPNRTAFIYFLNHIAPLLEKKQIDYRFFIAGKNNKEEIDWLINQSPLKNKENILNLSFVDTLADFFQLIDILVTPIFSGSGSRIKILESLSFGVPIISTPIGIEGINIKNKIIKIATNPSEFVRAIIQTKKDLSTSKHRILLKKLKDQLQPYLWSKIIKKYVYFITHAKHITH